MPQPEPTIPGTVPDPPPSRTYMFTNTTVNVNGNQTSFTTVNGNVAGNHSTFPPPPTGGHQSASTPTSSAENQSAFPPPPPANYFVDDNEVGNFDWLVKAPCFYHIFRYLLLRFRVIKF